MVFWTLDCSPNEPVTLCEDCALEATNIGVGTILGERFDSMDEAALIFNAMLAARGGTFPVASSNTGACGNCPKRIEVAQ